MAAAVRSPEEGAAVPSPVTAAEGAPLPADDVLSTLASQLRSPLLMLLAVTVMAVVDQIEITGSPSRQGQARRDETGGFWTRNAEQPQAGFGELVHGCLIDSFRMPLARPRQPEQAASLRRIPSGCEADSSGAS